MKRHKPQLLSWLDAKRLIPEEAELTDTLKELEPDELAHWSLRVRQRCDAGESTRGIGWRALVDVRLHFGHWSVAERDSTRVDDFNFAEDSTEWPDTYPEMPGSTSNATWRTP